MLLIYVFLFLFFILCNFKLVDGEFESAFLRFFMECAHCQIKLSSRLFTVNNPKYAISVVQVNKVL